jgi:hypothetical protein
VEPIEVLGFDLQVDRLDGFGVIEYVRGIPGRGSRNHSDIEREQQW